jgi:hypothetical protein
MNEEENTRAPSDCPHDDWEINGPETFGWGTCARCGQEVRLSELLRRWKARIERELGVK